MKEILFTIWDQDNHLQDDIIGCVRIPLEDIKDQLVRPPFIIIIIVLFLFF